MSRIAKNTVTIAAIGAAVALGACGAESRDTDAPQAQGGPAVERVDVNKDPYEVSCREIADPATYGPLIGRAAATLARGVRLSATELQIKARLQYAMIEICEGKDSAYTPARSAVKAVQDGRFVTELG